MVDDLHAHILSLRRYAYVLCRNHTDADDLVQETLLKAIAAARTYRPDRDLRAWLFSILHNTFLSHRRQYARRARAATFLKASLQDANTLPGQEKYVEAQHTLRMLSRLTPDQQSALILVAAEGLPYEEAAKILDIPIGTLMSRLARGREKLRQLVGDDGPNRLKAVK
ncbi:MAG TPA: sigma-70 family RNA polymerase sigma factor [Gammaproteobacteria bacterium]|nr:sigma-70 family RNA polymerase sigma factor [Gammaproteobacteria bacterium]